MSSTSDRLIWVISRRSKTLQVSYLKSTAKSERWVPSREKASRYLAAEAKELIDHFNSYAEHYQNGCTYSLQCLPLEPG